MTKDEIVTALRDKKMTPEEAADALAGLKQSPLEAKIVGDKLVIELPLKAVPEPSTSGKTLIVASSYGPRATKVQVKGKTVTVVLTAYISKK